MFLELLNRRRFDRGTLFAFTTILATWGLVSCSGGSGGGKSGNQAQEIEELARAAFEELQRLIQVARERSGDSWES